MQAHPYRFSNTGREQDQRPPVACISATVLFFLFQLSRLLYTMWLPSLKYICAAMGLLCFLYVLLWSEIGKTLVLMIIVYFCALMSALYTDNYRFEEFIMPLMYIGPGLLLLNFVIDIRYARLFLFFTILFYAVALSGILGSFAFGYTSENYVSIDMVNACAIYYIAADTINRKFELYPAITVAILCILSSGRAAIIAGTMLFALFLLYYLWMRKKLERKRNFFIVVVIIALFVAGRFSLFDTYIAPYLVKFYGSFESGFHSAGR
jgi:hypothetical protein